MTGVSAYAIIGNFNVDQLFEDIWVKTPRDVVDYIMAKVVATNGIDSIESIPAKSRVTEYVEARQWHMFLAIRVLNWSLSKAGDLYGKDHATALHARKCIINAVSGFDKAFMRKYADVIRECREYNSKMFI